jgi:hypothetical protein
VWPSGETEEFENFEDIELNLEWFDSESSDAEGKARVFDRLGRPVLLKVVNLELQWCELVDSQAES